MGPLEAVTLTTWHFEGLNSISHPRQSVKILLKHLSIARALNRQVNGRVVSKLTDFGSDQVWQVIYVDEE